MFPHLGELRFLVHLRQASQILQKRRFFVEDLHQKLEPLVRVLLQDLNN